MLDHMRVLVTGAGGFVGQALVRALDEARRFDVTAVTRSRCPGFPSGVRVARVDDIGPATDWSSLVDGIDVVVHAAAVSQGADPVRFREVNTEGTLNLARQAATAGVRRFVFVSTIKVNGESTRGDRRFRVDDAPNPSGPYAQSKHLAEEGLRIISRDHDFKHVIVRPPLVYGPGVRGNFLRLLRWVDQRWPFPSGDNDSHRSLIYLGNLTSFLQMCVTHPGAENQTFLVSDGEDLPVDALAIRLASLMGRSVRILRVPRWLSSTLGWTPPGARLNDRLYSPLRIDPGHACSRLGWNPPHRLDEGLLETVRWYQSIHASAHQHQERA